MKNKKTYKPASIQGFTLIELSIVLVIIGLLVGGVLVGRDLIKAAEIRAQVAQLDKYNTAVNTFRLKYNAIPGDMIPSTASALGFFTRTGAAGDGDGDSFICNLNGSGDFQTMGGENVLFWTDLSKAGLIDASLNDSNDAKVNGLTTDAQYAAEMPRAKIGTGNFIFANSSYEDLNLNVVRQNGFQIVGIAFIGTPAAMASGLLGVKSGLTPIEAYNIDQKIDDGLPLSGRVLAMQPDSGSTSGSAGVSVQALAGSSLCITGVTTFTYNIGTSGVSTKYNCTLRANGSW